MTIGRFGPDKLLDFFYWFDRDNPNHVDAVGLLQEECEALDPDLMSDLASWVRLYRNKTAPEVTLKFTPQFFSRLTGYSARKFDDDFCRDCAKLFEETGFSQHLEPSRMLMANLMHESGNFQFLKELASGQAYEGRFDLSNTRVGDGPKFKGCGPLQVTGRGAFQAFYEWLRDYKGIDDPKIMELGTNYVADIYPFSIAINWINRNNLLTVCLENGFDACCYKINGGYNGYLDRLEKYQICREYMK